MGKITQQQLGSVISWTLSQPKKGNAIDFQMLDDLKKLLSDLKKKLQAAHCDQMDTHAQPILLLINSDEESRHFCTGADIDAWSSLSMDDIASQWIDYGNNLFDEIENLPIPTVCAINGLCLGGGLELALACDIRIASEKAIFSFPEVAINAIPGWKGGQRLASLINVSRAKEIIFSGEKIDAKYALKLGMINKLMEYKDFHDEKLLASSWNSFVKNYCLQISAQPSVALLMAKKLMPNNDAARANLVSQDYADALKSCVKSNYQSKTGDLS